MNTPPFAQKYCSSSGTTEVLEVGCGRGTAAFGLARHTRTYLAADRDLGTIKAANNELNENPIAGLTFHVADAESLLRRRALAERSGEDLGPRCGTIIALNHLHHKVHVRELGRTVLAVHALLEESGLFISNNALRQER